MKDKELSDYEIEKQEAAEEREAKLKKQKKIRQERKRRHHEWSSDLDL